MSGRREPDPLNALFLITLVVGSLLLIALLMGWL